MITNSERREAAAELRRQAAYSSGSLGEWWQRLQDVALGEVDFPKPEQLFERLADLVDRPTCEFGGAAGTNARANTVRTVDVNRLRAIAHGLRHIGREGFNGYDINPEDKRLLAGYADGILRAIGEEG